MAAIIGNAHINFVHGLRFTPDINFGCSRVTRLAFCTTGSGRRAFFYFTFAYPDLQHTPYRIGIGVKVQGNVT